MDFDTSLLHYVIQSRRPWLDDVMVLASALGAAGFLWWMLALITGIFPARRPAAWRLLLAIGFTFLINDYVLRPIFDRARPFEVIPALRVIDAKPTTSSFPSGHAAMAMAGALAGSRMLPVSGWVLWPLGVIVAVSRVYVGVHWPSDVIAGAIVGVACAWFVLGGRPPSKTPGD
ncbi:MAG: phosphatase PAP2 family protein [Acidobacteriota bacterium]|nr:phosphatase PAP2 family protein [Acidobacteriota bacterium]